MIGREYGELKMYPNEQGMKELLEIRRKLYTAPSTGANLRKIEAIEAQIKRRGKVIPEERKNNTEEK